VLLRMAQSATASDRMERYECVTPLAAR
jgi:hypothetical protein